MFNESGTFNNGSGMNYNILPDEPVADNKFSTILKLFIDGGANEAPNICIGCSACCQFCGEPPFNSIAECEKWLSSLLRDELFAYYNSIIGTKTLTRGNQNLPCMWLDMESGTCNNYDCRPEVCRNFIVGGAECKHFINKIMKDS